MSNLMTEIDQRTGLAGTNKMEVLMFHLGTEEIYGLNVFKIREVMKLPQVTTIPDSDPRILGIVNLRGENIALVDLKQSIGLGPVERDGAKLIITEYNERKQGFLVSGVDRIIRMSWERIHIPPPMVQSSRQGSVTAVTKLDDGRMVLILDVEKVLAELHPKSDEEMLVGVDPYDGLSGKRILIADDSTVARKQIAKTLDRLGVIWEETCTGKEALHRLQYYAQDAESTGREVTTYIDGLLTDIEMPEMDGFSLTKHLRQDARFAKLPILMHSSLSGSCNIEKGKSVGVTDFVTKFDPKVLRQKLIQHIASATP